MKRSSNGRRIPYRVLVTWSDGQRDGSFWITSHMPAKNREKNPKKGIKNAENHEK